MYHEVLVVLQHVLGRIRGSGASAVHRDVLPHREALTNRMV